MQRNTKETRKERCTKSLVVALLSVAARMFSRRNKRQRPAVETAPRPKQAADRAQEPPAKAIKPQQEQQQETQAAQSSESSTTPSRLPPHSVNHHSNSPLYDCALVCLATFSRQHSQLPASSLQTRPLSRRQRLLYTRRPAYFGFHHSSHPLRLSANAC